MLEPMKARSKIEDAVGDIFNGEPLKNILNLIAFMRENKMNPTCSYKNSWISRTKKRVVCRFHIENDIFRATPVIGLYSSDSLSDEHKQIIWAKVEKRVNPCQNCENGTHCNHDGLSSHYGMKTVFGKKYEENVCGQSISFNNPDSGEVDCIKELKKLRKNAISMEN